MKKIFKITIYLFLIIFSFTVTLTGCVFLNISSDTPGSNTVRGQGNRENYEIRVGAFNKIKIEGVCDIRYNNGNSDTVTLFVQPNIREFIEVTVVDSELIMQTNRRINYNSRNKPVLIINAPFLNQVTIEGAGDFLANDKITTDVITFNFSGAGTGTAELDVNALDVLFSGAGEIKLSGRASNSSVTVSGAGNYDGTSLLTTDTTINLSGAGSVKVNAAGTLRINANGVGTIEYKGSPSLSLNTSGVVRIKNLD